MAVSAILTSNRTIELVPAIEVVWCNFYDKSDRQAIMSAISAKNLTDSMTRVKSSNLWACSINVKDYKSKIGDVYIQFKGKHGGPGDVYVYFDVPAKFYQRMISAPSKGHAFWQYIRGKYKYAKLTGDKRTKQKGGVNSPGAIQPSVLQLANSNDPSDRIKAANSTDDLKIFKKLAEDPNEQVRAAVARNCKDIDTLEDLVLDDSPVVRRALIGKKTNKDILRVLAYDDDKTIRYDLARSCDDPSVLNEMKSDPDAKIRNLVNRKLDKMKKSSRK